MLENMFIGRPPGNYDRLLDFSQALTGNLFFVPTTSFLDAVGDEPTSAVSEPPPSESKSEDLKKDGSLNIGSLKGDLSRE